jgi:hypothetical protein
MITRCVWRRSPGSELRQCSADSEVLNANADLLAEDIFLHETPRSNFARQPSDPQRLEIVGVEIDGIFR